MKVTIFVDGVDKGTLEVGGSDLRTYGRLVNACNELACVIYNSENPDGPDELRVSSNIRLVALPRRRSARR